MRLLLCVHTCNVCHVCVHTYLVISKVESTPPVLSSQPVISDSDDDSDHTDGNLFSRKKASEPSSRPYPSPQVKAAVKQEVQVGDGRPPVESPVREKVAKSDGASKSTKQELKVVVKRAYMSSSKTTPTHAKAEPMDMPTPVAQPASAKLKQTVPQPSPSAGTGAGKKRPHLEAKEEESLSSEEEEEEEEDDDDSSFDEEPNAQGLDEDESDYEGPSSDDEEFKVGRDGVDGARSSHFQFVSYECVETIGKEDTKVGSQAKETVSSKCEE